MFGNIKEATAKATVDLIPKYMKITMSKELLIVKGEIGRNNNVAILLPVPMPMKSA